jgi:Holliday junction DNA helicase RuvA
MIGRLKGNVLITDPDSLIIDVNGVGYVVQCPRGVISKLSNGQSAELWIETTVRQDAIQLYGFLQMEDKRWFNLLQSVQGVGAKVALNILSSHSCQDLVSALMSGNKLAFQKISGIGPKLAQRILLEMSDKLPKHIADQSSFTGKDINSSFSITSEAISAFVNLGFNRIAAADIVKKISDQQPSISLEELIRKGLQMLS